MRTQPYTKNYKHPRKAKSEEVVFPKKEHTNWLTSAKWQALKTYIQVRLYRLIIIYPGIYICMYIATYNNESRDHEF